MLPKCSSTQLTCRTQWSLLNIIMSNLLQQLTLVVLAQPTQQLVHHPISTAVRLTSGPLPHACSNTQMELS